MDLKCKMAHMRGQALGVGGVRYVVGDDGVMRDVADEHAQLLLKDPGSWAKHVTRQPAASQPSFPPSDLPPPVAPPPPPADDPDDEGAARARTARPKPAAKKTTKKKATTRRRGG